MTPTSLSGVKLDKEVATMLVTEVAV